MTKKTQTIRTIKDWLITRGGRNESDLEWDADRDQYYVFMSAGKNKGYKRVYVSRELIDDVTLDKNAR